MDFTRGVAREGRRKGPVGVRRDASRGRRRDRVVRGLALRSKGAGRAQRPKPVRAPRTPAATRRRVVPRGGSPPDDALVARPAGRAQWEPPSCVLGNFPHAWVHAARWGEGPLRRLVRRGPAGDNAYLRDSTYAEETWTRRARAGTWVPGCAIFDEYTRVWCATVRTSTRTACRGRRLGSASVLPNSRTRC